MPDAHAAHADHVAHQFEDATQQRESAGLGMWVFIVQEILFFGGLLAAYLVYRVLYREAFAAASHELDVKLGAFNTAVLLLSSLTMALAVHAAQTEEWEGYLLYEWLMEQWGSVTTTSQPYWPSRADITVPATSTDDAYPVLQVPGNAVMVDYLRTTELAGVFEENWGGGALEAPTVFHSGLHPTNFGSHYLRILDDALWATADEAMYDNDDGPVIYATAGEMVVVFPE